MAAPPGTVWGPVVKGDTNGLQGKLGIYVNKNVTDTHVYVTVQVWFASIYALHDGDGVGNNQNKVLYSRGTNVTAATGDKGEKKIYHTHNTGSGWNSNNQTMVYEETDIPPHPRGDANITYNIYAQFNGIDVLNHQPVYANTSYTVDAVDKFTIKYHANDKVLTNSTSLPPNQTKIRGQKITLSSTQLKTTGHTHTGWSMSRDFNYKFYKLGEDFDMDVNATLYANWKKNKYTITYDNNAIDAVGGKASDPQEHDTSIALPTGNNLPTRPNHRFLGWSTVSTDTVPTYRPGDWYKPNQDITLYAIWELIYSKPAITNVKLERCDVNGIPDDEGTYCNVSFSWKLSNGITSANIRVAFEDLEKEEVVSASGKSVTGNSGRFVAPALGRGLLNSENSYEVRVQVTDFTDRNLVSKMLKSAAYPIDVLARGKGIAFGKTATKNGIMDIGYVAEFSNTVNLGNSRLAGLGDLLPLPSNDLNLITEPGMYAIPNNTTAEALLNFPPRKMSGRLEVWTAHGTSSETSLYRMQRYSSANGNEVWTRFMYYEATNGWVYRAWQNDALRAYPVGSIYIGYSHTSPADLFGGEWERIVDRFLWAVGDGAAIGAVGGEQKHTLTINEMPSHQHYLLNYNPTGGAATWTKNAAQATDNIGYGTNVWTSETGGGQPHENMPPYIQVAMWYRTA